LFQKILSNNLLLLILLSSIWGSAFFAIKISVESMNPVTVASLRLIIGALFLYTYYKLKGNNEKISLNTLSIIFLIGLIGNFIPFFLISWSEQFIQSNTAGLLLSIAPILTLIFSHFFTRDDKFTYRKFLSILIGLAGTIFIIGIDSIFYFSNNNSQNLIPKLAIIIAAFGYVISAILAYNLKNISILTITTYVTIFAALISLPFMIVVEIFNTSTIQLKSIASLIYLGIFPTAIAFVLRFYIISRAGPIFLSYVAYLIPVFAIFWGYIFLKETISFQTGIGVLFVLIGVFISKKTNVQNS
tara:strand:- start:353 stop:1255 length:903 start_codon:yes stop_codon:yes gene_type:complete